MDNNSEKNLPESDKTPYVDCITKARTAYRNGDHNEGYKLSKKAFEILLVEQANITKIS